MNAEDSKAIEYSEAMNNYRTYFDLVGKGITIFLIIIGACLSLPYTLKFDDPQGLKLFKEMCRVFAIVVSIGGVSAYAVASYAFFRMHNRLKQLSTDLGIPPQDTWLMPFIVWVAIAVAVLLTFLLMKYSQ